MTHERNWQIDAACGQDNIRMTRLHPVVEAELARDRRLELTANTFSLNTESAITLAKLACSTCAVIDECRAEGLKADQKISNKGKPTERVTTILENPVGTWGGLSEDERELMAHRRASGANRIRLAS